MCIGMPWGISYLFHTFSTNIRLNSFSILLFSRLQFLFLAGSCYFSWKVVLAEEAGALAVIIFDTVDPQSTAVLAIAGPFPNPRTGRSVGGARAESSDATQRYAQLELWT